MTTNVSRQRLINLLRTFSLSPTASEVELRAAYFQRAKMVHPDAAGSLPTQGGDFSDMRNRYDEAMELLRVLGPLPAAAFHEQPSRWQHAGPSTSSASTSFGSGFATDIPAESDRIKEVTLIQKVMVLGACSFVAFSFCRALVNTGEGRRICPRPPQEELEKIASGAASFEVPAAVPEGWVAPSMQDGAKGPDSFYERRLGKVPSEGGKFRVAVPTEEVPDRQTLVKEFNRKGTSKRRKAERTDSTTETPSPVPSVAATVAVAAAGTAAAAAVVSGGPEEQPASAS
mmetsp:Transcript_20716/g.46145  ORF Transcript_20716/g.46145 Transcript_20716/m.46145 type:complete len:286 (+) Transcript_20716:58-915(+)